MTYYNLVWMPDKDQYWILPIGQSSVKKIVYRSEGMNDEQFEAKAIRQFNKFISENTYYKQEPKIIKTSIIY